MTELNEKFEFEQDGKTYSLYDLPAGFVIKDDLDLDEKDLTELPDLSDVVVEGNFRCSYNHLTSLKGAPKEVSGNFYCYNNQLTTLEGAPKEVSGCFYCYNNQLTTLDGAPQKVGGDFDCSNNELTSLEDAPQKVDGSFNCSKNQLTTLDGAPKEVSGNFYCYNNQLTSLFKLPQMKEDKKIFCDEALGQEYGFSDSSNSGINSGDLFKSSRYQNEVKIDELRQKKHQEDIEKRTKTTEKVQSAFDAWLKKNSMNPPEK